MPNLHVCSKEHIYIIFDVYCEALIKSSVFTFVNLGNNLCSSSVRQKIAEEDKVQTTTMCFMFSRNVRYTTNPYTYIYIYALKSDLNMNINPRRTAARDRY